MGIHTQLLRRGCIKLSRDAVAVSVFFLKKGPSVVASLLVSHFFVLHFCLQINPPLLSQSHRHALCFALLVSALLGDYIVSNV